MGRGFYSLLPVMIVTAFACGVGIGIRASRARNVQQRKVVAHKLVSQIVDNPESAGEPEDLLVSQAESKLLPPRQKARRSYIKSVIAEVKVVVGTPSLTEANRLVVRRLARGVMDRHKVRPTHMAAALPLIIEGVFTLSIGEIAAIQWGEDVRGPRPQTWLEWISGHDATSRFYAGEMAF